MATASSRASAQSKNKAKVVKAAATMVTDAATGEVMLPPATSNINGFRVKKLVTVPSLVLKAIGQKAVLTIKSEIIDSKVIDPNKPNEKPARVCDVFNHEDGRDYKFLVPTVVEHNLENEYAAGSYVGKTFALQNLGKRKEGQRYNDFLVAELESEKTA